MEPRYRLNVTCHRPAGHTRCHRGYVPSGWLRKLWPFPITRLDRVVLWDASMSRFSTRLRRAIWTTEWNAKR